EVLLLFFFSSRRRHTRFKCDWSSDVCSSDLPSRTRSSPLLEVRDLRTSFFVRSGELRVLDGIDLAIRPGEVLGLVGETGSGKSRSEERRVGKEGRCRWTRVGE